VKHQNLLNPRQLSAANRRTHGGDGKKIHRPRNHTPTPIPDTDATRLLQRYGVRSPAALRDHSAAPLAVSEHARRRQLELDAGPGMIVQILDDNGLVWKSCGKRVDNRAPMPPLDDEDAWRERYTKGPLASYIIGGESPPPTDAEPLPDPELDKYRRGAEHALIDGWMPPALRPMPPDDPELEKYRSSLSIPPWMREGGDT
jgi:hypothetical protein